MTKFYLRLRHSSVAFVRHNYQWATWEFRSISQTACNHTAKKSSRKISVKKKPVSISDDHKKPAIPRTQLPLPSPVMRSSYGNRIRFHPISILIGGTVVAMMGAYTTFIFINLSRTNHQIVTTNVAAQADVSACYDGIASTFDDMVDSNEYWLGITGLRKNLVAQARGHVLEVSIGTGRNLAFYKWCDTGRHVKSRSEKWRQDQTEGVKSLTAIDSSVAMLAIARGKFNSLFPNSSSVHPVVRWVAADATAPASIPDAPFDLPASGARQRARYDTIVQTMGLCSVNDPIALLRNMSDCLDEDGRILLLEHGRGHWRWLNRILDQTAESHAHTFGCWWNRDIRAIIDESGLEVVNMKTPKWWHGGTTCWIELKKSETTNNEPVI